MFSAEHISNVKRIFWHVSNSLSLFLNHILFKIPWPFQIRSGVFPPEALIKESFDYKPIQLPY